jgi:transforming growth factor-beta-induced protein
LEAAVIAAELADDLSGEGPFTVFAPTDAAFAALPEGTVEELLEDPTGALAQILLYHVVGAEAYSTDLSDGQMIMTLQGEEVTVSINDDGVFINEAKVTMADIAASNGVVHVIDAVILPPSTVSTTTVINSSLDVYPMPASSYFRVDLPREMSDNVTKVDLIDLSGKNILSKKVSGLGSIQVDVNGLKSGVYVLQLVADQTYYTEKIIIE